MLRVMFFAERLLFSTLPSRFFLSEWYSPLSTSILLWTTSVPGLSAYGFFSSSNIFLHTLCLPSPLFLVFSPLVSGLIREMPAWSIGLHLGRMSGYGRGVCVRGMKIGKRAGTMHHRDRQQASVHWSLFVICPLRSNTHMHKHTRCAIFSEHPACKWSP